MNFRYLTARAASAFVLCLVAAHPAVARIDSALDFNGINQYVEVPNPVNVQSAFTLEGWVLVRDASTTGRIFSNRVGGTGYEWDVKAFPETVLRLTINGDIRCTAPFASYIGTWTHIAATWAGSAAGGQTHLYINGELAGTGSHTGLIANSISQLRFGRQAGAVTGFQFDGSMDELRIWTTELSQATIQAWMSRVVSVVHPDFGALKGYWRFEEATGQTTASEVDSPGLDGRLGSSSGTDNFDPTWIDSGAVPIRDVSVTALKRLFREN